MSEDGFFLVYVLKISALPRLLAMYPCVVWGLQGVHACRCYLINTLQHR